MQAYCEPTLRSVSPAREFSSMVARLDLGLTYEHDRPTGTAHARGLHLRAPLAYRRMGRPGQPHELRHCREYFGYSTSRAEELMMAVHTRGRATVSTGVRERVEADVMAMHSYGLHATIEEDRD